MLASCSCPGCLSLSACSYTYTAADVSRVLKEKKAAGLAPRNVGACRSLASPSSLAAHAARWGGHSAVRFLLRFLLLASSRSAGNTLSPICPCACALCSVLCSAGAGARRE